MPRDIAFLQDLARKREVTFHFERPVGLHLLQPRERFLPCGSEHLIPWISSIASSSAALSPRVFQTQFSHFRHVGSAIMLLCEQNRNHHVYNNPMKGFII